MILALAFALAQPIPEGDPPSPCHIAIADHKATNTFQLGASAKVCEEEGREDDAAYFEVLMRIRAAADTSLIPPKNMSELTNNAEFMSVFADGNQFIDEDIARDPRRFAKLLERVREADLSISTEYDPGWTAVSSEKRALYVEVIEAFRADVLILENYIAKLVRDEVYFAAYLERKAMLADLSGSGGQLPDRFDEVTEIMKARVDVLGEPPTETAVPWRKIYRPGSNAPFTELYRGLNGPMQSETILFRSLKEVHQSWVGRALSRDELSQVMAQTDFTKEVLGVYAIGEMSNATENFFVTEFGPQADLEGHSIVARVGVLGEYCDFEQSVSYPFVLVKASSQSEKGVTSSFRGNYADHCAPVMAGKPTLKTDLD